MRSTADLIQWIAGWHPDGDGKDLLTRLEPRLRRMSIDWEIGSEYAGARQAEAVTIQDERGAMICFSSITPSRSAVLEELAHVSQGRKTSSPDEDIRLVRDRREVEAKRCLVENASVLGLPAEETRETERQLTACQQLLAQYEKLSS